MDGEYEDTVKVTAKAYDIKYRGDDCVLPQSELHLHNKPSAVLVGDNGLYHPRHKDYMHWLPLGLVVFPVEINNIQIGTVYEITMPRWLATKLGLKHND